MSLIRQVEKGWGHELIFANMPAYCGKILHFDANEMTSMHFHAIKEETFFVLSGNFIIRTINTRNALRTEHKLTAGEKMDIPSLLPHQIVSIDGGNIIEVSTHDYEDDSHRIEVGSSQTKTTQSTRSSSERDSSERLLKNNIGQTNILPTHTPPVEGDIDQSLYNTETLPTSFYFPS